MKLEEYVRHDATSLARLIDCGETSADQLLSLAQKRCDQINRSLNAIVTPLWREASDQISTGLTDGPLKGVPMSLKDLGQFLKGTVTSAGSNLFADQIADHDSTLVQRYKRAGLVMFGKSNTPEFGLATTTEPVLHGPTKNPLNIKYSAGGSSGGAAAAVASGISPVAHASDGGGSIRIPASCCGLFGLKPTRGRNPLGPSSLEGWGGLSTTHVITRSVRDSALILDCTHGAEPGSPYRCPAPSDNFVRVMARKPIRQKIAYCTKAFNGAEVDPEVLSILGNTADNLSSRGHAVEEIKNPFNPQLCRDSHGTLAISHIGAMLNRIEIQTGKQISQNDVETVTWNNYQSSKQVTGPDYANALHQVHQNGRILDQLFESYDLILSPTMACQTPLLGQLNTMSKDTETYLELLYQMIGFTALTNDTGHPAASLPLGLNAEQMPVGSQLIAPFGKEELLFQMGYMLEQEGLFTNHHSALGDFL
ncbi:MAG: hypothetical protein CMP93_06670 [Gammaproteobacteria bacterium]|nr:hypothetical protein [Gammaproteobacteria bacterium]